MRPQLPAFLTLMCVVTYSACGSSDSKVRHASASGESGQGGDAGQGGTDNGGALSTPAGAPNDAGSAGQAGSPALVNAGAGGVGGEGGAGGEGAADSSGGTTGMDAGGASAGQGPNGGAGGEGGVAATYKVVFVSSVAYTGNLGGLDGADAKCTALAAAADVPGTFKAWLSDATGSPSTRFTHPEVDYVFVDRTTVFAHGWTDLISPSPKPAFNVNELGGAAPTSDTACAGLNGGYAAWVSSTAEGTPAPGVAEGDHTCSNWSSEAVESTSVGLGSPTAGNSWIGFCSSGVPSCGKKAPIFCFEQ